LGNPWLSVQALGLKCQGLGHLATDYPNSNVITLEERKTVREEENQEEKKMRLVEELNEELVEIEEKANEVEILVLKTDLCS